LNTTSLALGPVFNVNESTARMMAVGTYAGWFPMIDFSLSHGGRAARYKLDDGFIFKDTWTETSADIGLRIPLNLSRGIHVTQLQADADVSLTRVSGKRVWVWEDNFNGNLIPFRYRLLFSNYRSGSVRDVAPHWGQVLEIGYRHMPFKSDFRGSQIFSQAAFYLPGLMPHHGVLIRAAWEKQNPENYLFSTSFPFSRGYDAVFHKRLTYASASYAFPLVYPDLALDGLVYLKRVKGRLFYDDTLGMDGGVKHSYRSFGAELYFETCFFNLRWPVDFGVRWVHRVEDRKSRVEPTLSLDVQ
jgi:hypothetical protein